MKESEWFQSVHDEFSEDFEYQLYDAKLDITESICTIMEKKKLSRSQLAEMMGTTPSAITKMLNGNSNFTLKTLLKLSKCLDHDLTVSFRPKVTQKEIAPWIASTTDGIFEIMKKWTDKLKETQQNEPTKLGYEFDANSVIPCVGTDCTT